MSHGFLTPQGVTGDNFWRNAKWLYNKADKKYGITDRLKNGLKDFLDQNKKTGGLISLNKGPVYAYEKGVANQVTVRDVTEKPAAKMLQGSSVAGALKEGTGAITQTDKPSLPPGGPGLSSATSSKGGTFTNIPGISAAPTPLNADTFFKRATTGTGDSGEYLSTEERKSLFAQSRAMRSTTEAASTGPGMSADSGVDIVAAVNQVTSAIINLQSSQQKGSADNVKALGRLNAAIEEQQMEMGGDYSGFLTPENFQKREKNKEEQKEKKRDSECSCPTTPFIKPPALPPPPAPIYGGPAGGEEGGFGLPLPISDPFEQWRSMPNNRGLEKGARNIFRRGAGRAARRGAIALGGKEAAKSLTKPAEKVAIKGIERGLTKGAAKLGAKALGKIPGVGLLTGAAFGIGRLLKGDLLGAAGELTSGVASTVPGIGTGISLGIDAALAAKDMATPETALAQGGIVTQPTTALIGDNPLNPFAKKGQAEGVFPLEGKEGKATFTNLGEGILDAQKDNENDYKKLQSKGLNEFFVKDGGFDILVTKMKEAGLGGGGDGGDGGNQDDDGANEGDMSGSDGQEQAMRYFMSQGMTKEQAAGIVGNLMQESGAGLDPNAKNESGHRGIAQWDANRWGNFEKWAKKKGLDVNTREAQLQWIMEEMKTGSGGLGIERFKKTKTAEEAGGLFLSDFERSGEKAGSAGYENRMKNARSLASRDNWGAGTGPVAGGGGKGKVIEYLTGDRSSSGYRADHGGNNYHEHLAFQTQQDRDRAMSVLRANGVQIGSVNDGKHAKGSYHYKNLAFDVPGAQVPVGQEPALSAKVRRILSKAGFSGSGITAAPGTQQIALGGGETSGAERSSRTASKPIGTGGGGVSRPRGATPQLSAASANTGTALSGASAQYSAMGITAGGGNVNNIYNVAGGGGGSQGALAPGMMPTGAGASQVGPGWFYQVAAARL
jgi:hypothetical protein